MMKELKNNNSNMEVLEKEIELLGESKEYLEADCECIGNVWIASF